MRPTTKVLGPEHVEAAELSGLASSRRTRAPQAAPARAKGTLNQKTQCQEIATSAPPSTGPSTSPIAATIVLAPIARPSSSFGNASVTSAAAFANRKAEPIPAGPATGSARRHRGEARASEARANMTNPPT